MGRFESMRNAPRPRHFTAAHAFNAGGTNGGGNGGGAGGGGDESGLKELMARNLEMQQQMLQQEQTQRAQSMQSSAPPKSLERFLASQGKALDPNLSSTSKSAIQNNPYIRALTANSARAASDGTAPSTNSLDLPLSPGAETFLQQKAQQQQQPQLFQQPPPQMPQHNPSALQAAMEAPDWTDQVASSKPQPPVYQPPQPQPQQQQQQQWSTPSQQSAYQTPPPPTNWTAAAAPPPPHPYPTQPPSWPPSNYQQPAKKKRNAILTAQPKKVSIASPPARSRPFADLDLWLGPQDRTPLALNERCEWRLLRGQGIAVDKKRSHTIRLKTVDGRMGDFLVQITLTPQHGCQFGLRIGTNETSIPRERTFGTGSKSTPFPTLHFHRVITCADKTCLQVVLLTCADETDDGEGKTYFTNTSGGSTYCVAGSMYIAQLDSNQLEYTDDDGSDVESGETQ